MVKWFFFHAAAHGRKAAARRIPRGNHHQVKRRGGRRMPARCAVVPAGFMPAGLFATLPRTERGDRRNQS
jgi:hypothetical protein